MLSLSQNFVGLSVYDGYIATGSETNEVMQWKPNKPLSGSLFCFDIAVTNRASFLCFLAGKL